jgi:hypothetical protein
LPDVLGGEDDHPLTMKRGSLAALDHHREVVERRVGVGPPRRLDPRRDVVVVLVAAAVVVQRLALERLLGDLEGDRLAPGRLARELERGQRGAGVAAGARRRGSERVVVDRRVGTRRARARGAAAVDVLGVRAAAARRSRDRESRAELTSKYGFSVVAPISVTSPVLDRGQQRVLLRLVEAVDLVEEETVRSPVDLRRCSARSST